jgi:hypothetical protein
MKIYLALIIMMIGAGIFFHGYSVVIAHNAQHAEGLGVLKEAQTLTFN